MKTTEGRKVILQIQQLSKQFDISHGIFNKKKQILKAVDQVDLTVFEGETLGIVGESGCGKSTLGNMMMYLTEPSYGTVEFDGVDFSKLSRETLRRKRKDIQMIFQDPFSSLNPRMKIFDIIAEPLLTHGIARGKELKEQVHNILEAVGLSPDYANRFPHQFSGGQRQRVGIGRAIALKPKLIVCDEPVSALDVSIQSQILNLLSVLQKRYGLTYVFIAHGLPAVAYISDRIAVMYLGRIVEIGNKEDLLHAPDHPYTEGLLASIPISDPEHRGIKRKALEGETPNPINLPSGCAFHTRCPYVQDLCRAEAPPLASSGVDRLVACHYPLTSKQEVQIHG
ncbi:MULTISPECIES: ABC transporter ATP-binding protein [unclassified Paenibacillus]|uniref:ABC transporter ATP-binding protein n=1 Tax=unclassified Paenibacillus TaxID=185978 RepID=UPI0027831562|nr:MULTISPECIES: oligopeptide/dipeptide ABC transporter ATP-binding protein [unclassified Paenibacillus]MDQ0902098.1 peptide/nickel transport system ATP-binding protein [Paenibacillus sp. V4I7]MDQ0919408.1 peptide/nickel transport system ATP-binding protein [Paenibacillus sp. V4I5]